VESPTAAEGAIAYQERLAKELNIHTTHQLIEGVDERSPNQRRFEECRAILRTNLMQALQAEVRRIVTGPAAALILPAVEQRTVEIEFSRIDVLQLSHISQKSQSFGLEIFLQCTIVGGANDPDLSSDSDAFPVDIAGRPTFRPSALWFLNQFEFQTLKRPLTTTKSSVIRAGNDIQLNKKIIGDFYDEFDGLVNFPFDSEELSFSTLVMCANEGKTPVRLSYHDSCTPFIVDQANFSDRNAWVIASKIYADFTKVRPTSERSFPALRITLTVYREPFFFIVNVVLPSGIFALAGVLLLLLPLNFPPSRLVYILTLVLTVVTYKLAMSSSMPEITYLTLLDKYQLACACIMLVVLFETIAVGSITALVNDAANELDQYGATAIGDAIDWATFGLCMLFWIATNVWWISKWWNAVSDPKRRSAYAAARRSHKKQAEENASADRSHFTRQSMKPNSPYLPHSSITPTGAWARLSNLVWPHSRRTQQWNTSKAWTGASKDLTALAV